MGPTRPLGPEQVRARKERQVLEKDATEIALENALFGNSSAFLKSLTQSTDRYRELELYRDGDVAGEAPDSDDDAGLEDVADEDLFFLDGGDASLPDDVMEDLQRETDTKKADRSSRPALWHDSDDDRLVISLASNTRLRKLRDTEQDDIVMGPEYIRRLRRQYERLHPTPDWVKYARKKRKITRDDESDSDSDVSIDMPLVKPLAELIRSSTSLTRDTVRTGARSATLNLRPDAIDIQRLKDIASSGPSSVDTLEFHAQLPLVMTAGPSSTINLYHLSPTSQNPNPILTSLHIKGTPISTALFAQSSNTVSDPETRVYMAARRRYFHAWSLTSGSVQKISRPLYQSSSLAGRPNDIALVKKSQKNHEMPTCERMVISPGSQYLAIISNTGSNSGVVHILNATTHQPICQVRVDSLNGIADLAFYRDNSGLSVVGKNGEVTEFNIAQREVTARWTDEGAVGTTTLALGGQIRNVLSTTATESMGDDRYIAIGSTSGVVTVYDRIHILQRCGKSHNTSRDGATTVLDTATFRPTPLRTLDNLTTPISHLHFSHDAGGQLLVMASRWKKNALRLVHLPSCSVYKNWPTDKTPLGRISSVALSHDGAYLAIGNEAGKVRLWQIRD